ncbi:hypothetical protein [Cylindrospermopsis raciborskii]|uniref:hypothetical protein n=1 Tax=Cylindrospermopsis raciborskii TaxID=77022 RepID=UPI000778BBA9|nr:hypothetical protein [Cylindrospermopsis raciborskii]
MLFIRSFSLWQFTRRGFAGSSQIANDSTWQELLDYLTEEIARLEYLDIENSTSNEEKRKKYSLEACFNLSLKSLTQEELKQFIWFGILPEDVVITHKMAATL